MRCTLLGALIFLRLVCSVTFRPSGSWALLLSCIRKTENFCTNTSKVLNIWHIHVQQTTVRRVTTMPGTQPQYVNSCTTLLLFELRFASSLIYFSLGFIPKFQLCRSVGWSSCMKLHLVDWLKCWILPLLDGQVDNWYLLSFSDTRA